MSKIYVAGNTKGTYMRNIFIFFLTLVVLVPAACSDPLKVTDPNDPNFNPDKFSFSDYKDHEEITPVLQKLFPIGTPQQYVEKILVEIGHAYIVDITDRELTLTAGGDKLTDQERAAMRKKINDAHENASATKIYLKSGESPIFVGWNIIVFYDANNQVFQIVSLNKAIF